jgi:hypothetical protein
MYTSVAAGHPALRKLRRSRRSCESDGPDPFVYAGKAHPELRGADLVVTYAANGPDRRLFSDLSIYSPRFVRVQLSPVPGF